MKKIVFALCAFTLTPAAFADSGIYDALEIKEVDVTNGRIGASTFEKKVGGLVCRKVQMVTFPPAEPKYDCGLKKADAVGSEIYDALGTEEKNITPKDIVGASTFQKKVGRLSCEKSVGVYPGAVPKISCALAPARKASTVAPAAHGGEAPAY